MVLRTVLGGIGVWSSLELKCSIEIGREVLF